MKKITRNKFSFYTPILLLALSFCFSSFANKDSRKHPFLFADQAMIDQAKERAATYPWAEKVVDNLIKNADRIIQDPIEIPKLGGQWSHHYVCKECGTKLKYKNGKHLCPNCGKEYAGWPYDEVVAAMKHRKNLANVETLGLAYALSGNEDYARYARDILLKYADVYTSYPFHDYKGGKMKKGARLLAQTLDESTSIIGTAWGFDLIYSSPSLTDEQKTKIEDRFFREVAKTIARNDMGISNWQSWHNAARSSIGYCIGDEEMVSDAIDGKSGFRFQMRESVLEDGFWYEGSPAYHFYSLDALRWTALGAKMAGTNLVDIPQFRAMFKAPTRYLFPDMTCPNVNDSYSFSISKFSGLYEIAYSWYGDSVYALIANEGKRNSIEVLFWGKETLPKISAVKRSEPIGDSPGVGGAILTQVDDRNNPIAVHIHYGPHGGYHGHPDKLALIAYANGKVILPDPGRVAYASPLQKGWYKTTLAHNTLVVDRKNQKEAKARSIRFCELNSLSAVQAECPGAYPGVNMVRTTVVTPNYLIDLFTADSNKDHVFDLPYHFEGKIKRAPAMEPCKPLGEKDGYDQLKDLSQSPFQSNWSTDFFVSEKKDVRFTLLGDKPSEIYLSSGRIDNPPRFVPMLLLSQSGKQARFLSLLEPFEGSPSVTKVKTEDVRITGKTWIQLTIDRSGQKETIEILQPKLPLKKAQEFIRYRKSLATDGHR